MLVAVREFSEAEIANLLPQGSPQLERCYHLFHSDNQVTLIDVTDSRARKTLNCDALVSSTDLLFTQVAQPLLHSVATPHKASQALLLVDGVPHCRCSTLLDQADGLLARTGRALLQEYKDVDEFFLSAITLDDYNILIDVLSGEAGTHSSQKEQDSGSSWHSSGPILLEDKQDAFTAIENTTFMKVESEAALRDMLQLLRDSFSKHRHHVYSFTMIFSDEADMANTTIQFVSLAVEDHTKGPRSTRHCIQTAAALIECRSPVTSFEGTKVTHLLKPALMGNQPGAWVSCFAPVSPVDGISCESFKDAFAVAHIASHIYSSRVGVSASLHLGPSGCIEGGDTRFSALSLGICRALPATHICHPDPAHTTAQSFCSQKSRPLIDDLDSAEDGPACSTSFHTGAGVRVSKDAASGKFCMPQARQTTFGDTPFQSTKGDGLVFTPTVGRRCATGRLGVSKKGAIASEEAGDEVRPRTKSIPQQSRGSEYELKAYRHVMEGAMSQLRRDMVHYATELGQAKKELQRMHNVREQAAAVDRLQSVVLQLEAENDALRHQLIEQRRCYREEAQIFPPVGVSFDNGVRGDDGVCRHSVEQLSAEERAAIRSRLHKDAQTDQLQKGNQGASVVPTEHAGRIAEELFAANARVHHLMGLIQYHQQEIETFVAREHQYQARIDELEHTLRERDEAMHRVRSDLELQLREMREVVALQRQSEHCREYERQVECERQNMYHAVQRYQQEVADREERLANSIQLLRKEGERRQRCENDLERALDQIAARDDVQAQLEQMRGNYKAHVSQLYSEIINSGDETHGRSSPRDQARDPISHPAPLHSPTYGMRRGYSGGTSPRSGGNHTDQSVSKAPCSPASSIQKRAGSTGVSCETSGNHDNVGVAETEGLRPVAATTRELSSTVPQHPRVSFDDFMRQEPKFSLRKPQMPGSVGR